MQVYMYRCIHMYVYLYTHACIHVDVRTHMYIYITYRMRACIPMHRHGHQRTTYCTFKHVYIHPSIHPSIHIYLDTYLPTYLPTYVRICMPTCIHISSDAGISKSAYTCTSTKICIYIYRYICPFKRALMHSSRDMHIQICMHIQKRFMHSSREREILKLRRGLNMVRKAGLIGLSCQGVHIAGATVLINIRIPYCEYGLDII